MTYPYHTTTFLDVSWSVSRSHSAMQRQHMARRTRLNDSGAPWNGNSSLANVESVKQRLHMTRGHAGSLAIKICHFLRFFFNFFICDLAKACSTTVV